MKVINALVSIEFIHIVEIFATQHAVHSIEIVVENVLVAAYAHRIMLKQILLKGCVYQFIHRSVNWIDNGVID